jgi:hypothetical protein
MEGPSADSVEKHEPASDDRLKTRVGIGILRIEIGNDPRVLAVAQPVVVIDPHIAKGFEYLRHHRRNRGGVCRHLDRVGGAQWQATCKRNGARCRESEGEVPSIGKLTHEKDLPCNACRHRGLLRVRLSYCEEVSQPRFFMIIPDKFSACPTVATPPSTAVKVPTISGALRRFTASPIKSILVIKNPLSWVPLIASPYLCRVGDSATAAD